MVQPSFSSGEKEATDQPTATAVLDVFLDKQHQSYYEELYQSEAACLCLLRLLPPICRQIILHFLWSHQPLRSSDLKAFMGQDIRLPIETLQHVVRPLINRKMIGAMQMVKKVNMWPVGDAFKKGLRNALTGMGTSDSFGVPHVIGPEDDIPTVDELIGYGEETWEGILKYMVSSGLDNGLITDRPRDSVLNLLHASGLMSGPIDPRTRRPFYDRLTITSKGFQFLLEERQTQVWQILIYYLGSKDSEEANSAPILSLFLTLGVLQLGHAYSASASFPSEAQQRVLEDLEHYGFIYRGSNNRDYFYATHLATTLCSGDLAGQLGGAEGEEKRFLILETNYKIYAYTSNELEIAILNLFVDIRIRYPNLVVGKLDRAHVKSAMEKGISAHQIIAYLQTHAHGQMHSSPPPLLHPTIVDQLHLWDKERNRLKTEEGKFRSKLLIVTFAVKADPFSNHIALKLQFFSKELYDDVLAEVKRYDGLIYHLESDKMIFIDPRIKEGVREFIQQQKQTSGY